MRLRGLSLLAPAAAMIVLAAMSAAHAQAPARVTDASELNVFALERLMTRSEQVMLRSAADRYAFYLPLSPRARVRKATLDLVFTNSISLLEPRSQLRVRINGKVVGQTLLEARNPAREIAIDLPSNLMTPGYNELEVFVAQHYANQCENPMSPELWTNVDTVMSRLTFEYDLAPVADSLADISLLIDPLGWNPFQLTLMTGADELQESDVTLGAGLSQGVAGLLRYRPLKISHAAAMLASPADMQRASGRVALIGNPADTDVILFGTSDQIAPFLPESVNAEIVGPYIGITRHVGDESRFVLVISGRDSAEVSTAARAFTLAGAALPDVPGMTVDEAVAPEVPRYANSNAIEAGKRYGFSGFGAQTTTLGGGSDRMEFEIWLPPDLFVPADSVLEVHVHMAYGAGSDPGSVVNLELNEQFSSAIRLVSEDGGIFRDYVIPIPASWLRPGSNTLRFNAFMAPMSKGDICFAPSDSGLFASIFDDSWLLLTEARHHVELPNLQLTSRTGYPYSTPADGSELHVRTTSMNPDVVASAWMLMGKMAQLGGIPPWRATIGAAPAGDDRHEIVVGPIDELPPSMIEEAPIRFGTNGLLKATMLEMAAGREDSEIVRGLFSAGESLAQPAAVTQAIASVSYSGSPDARSYLLQYESPTENGRLVTLVTSSSGSNLHSGVDRLVEFDLWGSLKGDLAIWDLSEDSAHTANIGPKFHIGQPDVQSRASFFFSQRPGLWVGLLIVAALVFAFTSVRLLRERMRKQA
jgi:hypothetical protein